MSLIQSFSAKAEHPEQLFWLTVIWLRPLPGDWLWNGEIRLEHRHVPVPAICSLVDLCPQLEPFHSGSYNPTEVALMTRRTRYFLSLGGHPCPRLCTDSWVLRRGAPLLSAARSGPAELTYIRPTRHDRVRDVRM